MYIKSFLVENFRKFKGSNGKIMLAASPSKEYEVPLSSTMIIGQNNAGKTSIVTALQKSTIDSNKFTQNDFNYDYLQSIINFYFDNQKNIEAANSDSSINEKDKKKNFNCKLLPFIKFTFEIHIDSENDDSDEMLLYIAPIITNDLSQGDTLTFSTKYQVKEEEKYIKSFLKFMSDKNKDRFIFSEFLNFLEQQEFEYVSYIDGTCTRKVDFNPKDLIKVNQVSYRTLHDKSSLSVAFNKIYKFKINNNSGFKEQINEIIKNFNQNIDGNDSLKNELIGTTNIIFGKIVEHQKASMNLRSNLTIDTLLTSAVKYFYEADNYDIPEDQFGMGYKSLMLIIAELIDYVENSPDSEFRNKINVLFIEEPECYMHPQLQTQFIKNINAAVNELFNSKNKNINCQILITTHSSYILKGKLDVENTFNNINYISYNGNGNGNIINLRDQDIKNDSDKGFEFLKRRFIFGCCDMFFADACIMVEGFAEETLLPYYISKDSRLQNKYISIVNINGRHFSVYEKLLKMLKIPVVVITDLDISVPKENVKQIESIGGTVTSNKNLEYYGIKYGKTFSNKKDNIYITTQNIVEGYYPTSFEEAYILTNYNNSLIKDVIKSMHPQMYKKYVKDSTCLKENSRLFQMKLEGNKGKFATDILYSMFDSKYEKELPSLPQYIVDGFDYIAETLSKKEGGF